MSLETETREVEPAPPAVQDHETAAFALAQRQAKMMASSTLLPKAFQGNIANVMMAMNLSKRLRLDTMMVAQNIHIIHDRPSWSSSFIGALINNSGKFGPVRFVFRELGKCKIAKGRAEGIEFENRECRAVAKSLVDGEIIEGPPVTMEMAYREGWVQKDGSKWVSMPDLMLRYRALAFFGRLHAGEELCGLPMDNEVQDFAPAIHETKRPRVRVDSKPVEAEPEPERKPENKPEPPTDDEPSVEEMMS